MPQRIFYIVYTRMGTSKYVLKYSQSHFPTLKQMWKHPTEHVCTHTFFGAVDKVSNSAIGISNWGIIKNAPKIFPKTFTIACQTMHTVT